MVSRTPVRPPSPAPASGPVAGPAARARARSMSPLEAWSSHVANLLVGGTGLVYAWMAYLAEPSDPFALVNHPWQPTLQHLHVLSAPLLVFATALFWSGHVWRRVRAGHLVRRTSGLGLFALFAPMALSGYLLQTATDERWRRAFVVLHVASSCLWIVAYGAHLLWPRRRAAGQPGVRG